MSTPTWLVAALLLAPVLAIAGGSPSGVNPEKVARGFIGELEHKDYVAASKRFDTRMAQALSVEKLKGLWEQLAAQAGAFEKIESVQVTPAGPLKMALCTSRFAKAPLVLKVVVDDAGQVAGFFIAPAEQAVDWKAPSYASADQLEEHPVQVGTAPALPGVLTTPRGKGPFAAVVLVHGSGPEDDDETIGGNKVFKDLAWGLANKGVASLRYVKRTKHSPMGVVTVKEEVLDGAHEAIVLLQKTPNIDPKRIYVLGHSQGGYLAPRMAAQNKDLAGLVLLAGSARPEQELWVEQVQYLLSLDPEKPELKKLLEDTRAAKKMVEDPKLEAKTVLELPFGGSITGAYLLDLRGYEPAKQARSLTLPMLVLQGGRDYQVTQADFDVWKKELGGEKRVQFKQYPSLNHLFIAGEGKPSPAEYLKVGHVDEAVVRDIAAFVKGSE